MIAFAAAKRLEHGSPVLSHRSRSGSFTVRPRWELQTLAAAV
jgi:hypothetical protein